MLALPVCNGLALAALAALMSTGGSSPGWRLWGRAGALDEARAARDAAIEAFYAMDRAQRDTAVRVDAYTNLDVGSSTATRIRSEFDELNTRAEHLAGRYIATLDAYPLDDDQRGQIEPGAAAAAFRMAARDLDAAATELATFGEKFADELARVERALADFAPRATAAREALERARSAMAAARSAGGSSRSADQVLESAESAATTLDLGAGRLGIAAGLHQADQVRALAERALALAEELPRRREQLHRRLVSLRTRRGALEYRAGAIPKELRLLRRGFVEACWRDVEDAEARVAAHLADTDQALARATTAVAEGDWDGAAVAVRQATGALDQADRVVGDATGRRSVLEAVKADPQARISPVRFQVRDAQRLVMLGNTVPPQPWAGQLDALALRLQATAESLDRPHPDYKRFLDELDAIARATTDVVNRFRARP